MAPGVYCLGVIAQVLWGLGYGDQALQRIHEACSLAEELAHPPTLAVAQYWAARFYHLLRDAR